jgi:proline iminopeptidase
VTHYWAHDHWLHDGALLNGAANLAGIPGALIHGSTCSHLWTCSGGWPASGRSQLTHIDAEGHGGGDDMNDAVTSATDAFADRPHTLA